MLYSIENENLKVTVSDYGAELMSIIGKTDGCEYIWQGDYTSWFKHSAVLFPFCNKVYKNKYTYLGKEYPMGLHGFASYLFFDVIAKEENSITLELRENKYTLPSYPFRFSLKVTYALDGNTLFNTFDVTDTDDRDLHFTLGGHPGFRLPLLAGEAFDDYYVEFKDKCRPKRAVTYEGFRKVGEYTDFSLRDDKFLDLSYDLFRRSTIFLSEMSDELTICSRKSSKKIKVNYSGIKYVQLWQNHKGNRDFMCVEPWCSQPPRPEVYEISTEPEFEHIAPGESFKKEIHIEIIQ